jgi:hypothetical protein
MRVLEIMTHEFIELDALGAVEVCEQWRRKVHVDGDSISDEAAEAL